MQAENYIRVPRKKKEKQINEKQVIFLMTHSWINRIFVPFRSVFIVPGVFSFYFLDVSLPVPSVISVTILITPMGIKLFFLNCVELLTLFSPPPSASPHTPPPPQRGLLVLFLWRVSLCLLHNLGRGPYHSYTYIKLMFFKNCIAMLILFSPPPPHNTPPPQNPGVFPFYFLDMSLSLSHP